jgi:hypothetical protein
MVLFAGVETSSNIRESIYIIVSRATDNGIIPVQSGCLCFAKSQLFEREQL